MDLYFGYFVIHDINEWKKKKVSIGQFSLSFNNFLLNLIFYNKKL